MHEKVKNTWRSRFMLGIMIGCAGCSSDRSVRADQPAPRAGTVSASDDLSTGCSDGDLKRQVRQVLSGYASFYADSLSGNPTASGVPYDPALFSAAHRTLPFGTRLRVTRTDASAPPVCVTVNDRGPFHGRRRIVDLSRRAAEAIGMVGEGIVPVRVDVL